MIAKTKNTPAVAYYRMSTDRQEASIPDQRKAVTEYAAKNGYTILREYIDEGISGDATEKRVQFQKMIADAKRADFAAVLCWDQSRFGRFDSIEAGYWIFPLIQAGVTQLVTVADGVVDWVREDHRMLFGIKQDAGMRRYLTDLSRNVTRGLLNSALAGRWVTGKPPYGYELQDSRLVLGNPVAIEQVRSIFDAYIQPGSSLTGIAEQLNARGEKGPTGGIWRVQTVQAILRNPNYTGDFVWNRRHHGKYHGIIGGEIRSHGEVQAACRESDETKWQQLNRLSDRVVIADSHPAIVSRETFDKVQALLKERRMRTTPHRGGGTFLFSDMLRCGHCGAKLYGADRKSVRKGKQYVYRRYVCASYVQSGRSVCRHHAVLEEPLRDLLTSTLQERILAPENFERLRDEVRRQLKARKSAGAQQPADAIRKEVAKLDKQLDAAADRLLKVPESLLDTVVAKMEQLRSERDRLQAQLNAQAQQGRTTEGRLEDDVDRAMKRAMGLSDVLTAGNPAAVRDVFRQTVERIDCWFGTEVRGKRTYYPLLRGLIRLRSVNAVTGLVQQATARHCARG